MSTRRLASGEKDAVKVTAAINHNAEMLDRLGEIVESDIAFASAGAISSAVAANVTSIVLTAGEWDVTGVVYFTSPGATTISWIFGSISATSATTDATNGRFAGSVLGGITIGIDVSAPPPACRFLLSAPTTTLYLVALALFGTSTLKAYGHLRARRVAIS